MKRTDYEIIEKYMQQCMSDSALFYIGQVGSKDRDRQEKSRE